MPVFKILLTAEWAAFQAAGTFEGSPFDLSSGYIHLSTGEQLPRTAKRRFADAGPLVLLEIDTALYGDQLRWEPMPNGDTYPHLYATLTLDTVLTTREVPDATAIA